MINKPIRLSYIYVTKNKVDFVMETLHQLVINKEHDDEIIVIDGKSSDGTVDYLLKLKEAGSIDVLISEQDINESHAWNKGFLIAKGEIIKLITDDDFFFYSSIKHCKSFLIANKDVEFLCGSVYDVKYLKPESLRSLRSALDDFQIYKDFNKPFAFCGLSLMFRKSALSKYGLFSTLTFAPDTDFTLRITRLNANLVYYNNPICIRIENELSIFSHETAYKFEYEGVFLQYIYKTITLRDFLFFTIKFYFKSQFRNLFYSSKIYKKNLEVKDLNVELFYADIMKRVTLDFIDVGDVNNLFMRKVS
jgi:glycosyltransferase involved in cell wall biosynthesis